MTDFVYTDRMRTRCVSMVQRYLQNGLEIDWDTVAKFATRRDVALAKFLAEKAGLVKPPKPKAKPKAELDEEDILS